jgi:hypothetical protein
MSVSGPPSSSGASSPPPVKPAAPPVKPSSTSNSGGTSGSGSSTVSKPTPSNSTTSTNNNPPAQPSSKAMSKDLPDAKSSTGPDQPSQSSGTRPDPLRQDPRDTSGRVQLAMASPTARGTSGRTPSEDSPTETSNPTISNSAISNPTTGAKKPVTLTSTSTTAAVISPVAKSVAEPVKPPTPKEPESKSPESKDGKDSSTALGGTSKLAGITTSAPVSIEVKEKATKLGLDPKTLETLSPADQVKMLARADRAVDIGLKPDASEEAIATKIKTNARFTAGTANANADDTARMAVNKEVATLKESKATGADKLTEVPTAYKSTVQDEVAARLRIDTRGKTPDAVAKEIQARTARLNGMDPAKAAGMSTDDLKASNRRASLDWLAKQGLSGIKPDATGAYQDVTHEQMLAGYRSVYGMDKNATWADVQQKWQERNATALADRIQRENLGQSATDYYRGIAGLPAVKSVPETPTPGGTGGAPPGTAAVNKRPMIAVLDDFTARSVDLNGDMVTVNKDGTKTVDFSKADLSHGNAVVGFLKDRGVSEADIFRLDANRAGVEPGKISDGMIQAQLNGLIRGKDGKDPFLSRVETLNMSFERSLTFDQLGTLLQNGQPALRPDLAGALKALQDPKTTNPEAARTLVRDELYKLAGSPAAGPAGPLAELQGPVGILRSIEALNTRGVQVVLAAGNSGPNTFNLYSLANGVQTVGAVAAPGGPVLDFSGSNALVKDFRPGAFPIRPVNLPSGQPGIDFTGDNKADIPSTPGLLSGGPAGPKPQGVIAGTSFSSPLFAADVYFARLKALGLTPQP